MYATTGRNAPSKTSKVIDNSNIEMSAPSVGGKKWYSRVPSGNNEMQNYVLGDEEDEEDEMAPRSVVRVR